MKKIVSLLLAIIMAFSVMSAVSATVFAKTVYEFENSSVKSVEFSFDRKTIVENTNGFWDTDENGERFYHYMVGFDKGDKAVFVMADGTKRIFTYKEKAKYDYATGRYYDAFSDENGISLYWADGVDQRQAHWGIGSHVYKMEILTFDDVITCDIPVDIIKMPFADLGEYDIYNTYVAYTSIYNKFIAGTNPPKSTEFSPRTAITRAMFVAILYRMAGNSYESSNPYANDNPFTDIQPGAYYYNAACWVLDEGITNQTTFKPFDNVTREQTARFLFAYAEANNILGDEEYLNTDISDYPDYDSVHSRAAEPLQWANYNDMMTAHHRAILIRRGNTKNSCNQNFVWLWQSLQYR